MIYRLNKSDHLIFINIRISRKRELSSTTVRIYLTLIKVICLCTNNSSYNLYFSMYSYKR